MSAPAHNTNSADPRLREAAHGQQDHLEVVAHIPPALCRGSAVALSAMILTIAAASAGNASRRQLWGVAANAPVRLRHAVGFDQDQR